MTRQVYNVLFVCTHNSARSIMAEGFSTAWAGADSRRSPPAATRALGAPVRVEDPAAMHMPTDGLPAARTGASSRWPGAPELDFVFTVCDKAAGEVCPVWPGQPMTAHWGVADPAAFEGTDGTEGQAFWDTAVILKRRIELMLALPLASLDRMASSARVRDIGSR
jgi:arsenate reductase